LNSDLPTDEQLVRFINYFSKNRRFYRIKI